MLEHPSKLFITELEREQPWTRAEDGIPIWLELIIYGAGLGAFLWLVVG